MQAKKDHPDWPVGWFGVVEINDPTFVFQGPPVCDPYFGRDDDDEEVEDEAFLLCLDEVIEAGCKASVFEAYRLVEACVRVGFDPEEGGFEAWLVHKMGLVFEKYKEQQQ